MHSSESKRAREVANLIFTEQVGKAFLQKGCVSPFSYEISKIRVSTAILNAKLKDSCLAFMLILERYYGYQMLMDMKMPVRAFPSLH